MKPHEEHRARGKHKLAFRLVTVSSSRFAKKKAGIPFLDDSGDTAATTLTRKSHLVEKRELISDDQEMIHSCLKAFLESDADVLVFMGGTGLSPKDITIETVLPTLEKELPGFGEIFRTVSYRKIGTAAAMTRATAGTVKGRLVVCLPGSPDAVATALRLFMPEFPHMVSIASGR